MAVPKRRADLSFLSAAGSLVSAALERAHKFDVVEARRGNFQRELEMARTVQASLLPQKPPEVEGYDVAADWRSAYRVAGDFYDWFELPDHRWAFIIGDVTDKGAPAALYMTLVRGLLRSLAPPAADPAGLLATVNNELYRYASTGMFVTVFCAFLDPLAGSISYANAGHNPPLLARNSGGLEQLPPTGPLLGVMETIERHDPIGPIAPKRCTARLHGRPVRRPQPRRRGFQPIGQRFKLDRRKRRRHGPAPDHGGL